MTATRSAELATLRRELDGILHQINGYSAMRQCAQLHGMEAEIERMSESLAEYNGEYDAFIERAAAAGFGPEDFE